MPTLRMIRPILGLAALLLVGCADDAVKPTGPVLPPRTLNQLLSSPRSLEISGRPFTVNVWLGRDFMPISSPEGGSLYGAVWLNSASPALLHSVSDVYVWVIRDHSEIWSSTVLYEYTDPQLNGAQVYEVGGGPRWDTGIHVDVVVGVRAGGATVNYVLVPNVLIGRSE